MINHTELSLPELEKVLKITELSKEGTYAIEIDAATTAEFGEIVDQLKSSLKLKNAMYYQKGKVELTTSTNDINYT